MNRFHPDAVRKSGAHLLVELRQPRALFFIAISAAMAAVVLSATLLRVVVAAALLAPFRSAGPDTPIVIFVYLVIAIILISLGRRGRARRAAHIVLGDGWSGWAMFWLWCITLTLVLQPVASILGQSGIYDAASLTTLLAAAVGLILFQRGARRMDGFPRRDAVIALAAGIAVWFILGQWLRPIVQAVAKWAQVFGDTVPDTVILMSADVFVLALVVLMLLAIVSRRIGFGPILRLLALLVIGTLLLILLCIYPAYGLVFTRFVPGQHFGGTAFDSALAAALALSAIVTVLVGSVAVWLLRPASVHGRVLVGALAGMLLGGFAFTILGGWIAGVSAQAPIYGFALSREGFNDAEWLLKFAIAVDNTVPAAVMALVGSVGLGALLAGIGGLVMPVPTPRETPSDDLPTWTIVSLIAVPALQSCMLVGVIILTLLGPSVRNIFITFGYEPLWRPEWIAPAVALPQFAIMASMALALIVWLNRTYCQDDGRAANPVFLNALFLSGALTAIGGFIQALSGTPDAWWSVLIGIWAAGTGIEILRLSLVLRRGTEPLTDRRRWVSAGMLAGLVTMIASWILVAAALSLVLIAVVFIVDLTQTSEPAPGLAYLLDHLDQAVMTMMAIPLFAASGFMVGLGLAGFLMVMDLPAALLRTVWQIVQRLRQRLPGRLSQGRTLPRVLIAAAAAVDILFIHVPVLTFLTATLVIRPDMLRRVPRWLLALALLGLAVFSSAALVRAVDLSTYTIFVEMGAVVCGVIVYHLIGLYVPASRRAFRYMSVTAGLGIMLGVAALLSHLPETLASGVSRFDGARWTVYDQSNSTLGTNLPTSMVLRPDGSLWFANNGGAISTYDGTTWTLNSLANIDFSLSGVSGDRRLEVLNRIPYLRQDADGVVWFASGLQIGRVLVNTAGIGSYEVDSLCGGSVVAENDPGAAAVCQPFGNLGRVTFSHLTPAEDGALWFSGGDATYRLSDGHLTEQQAPSGSGSFAANAIAASGDAVWLATDAGLYRYDGARSQLEPVPGMTAPVSFVAADAQGQVWVRTASGLIHLAEDGSSEIALSGDQLQALVPDAALTVLASDADGVVWIGTERGLLRFDLAQGTTDVFTAANSGLATDKVIDVTVDTGGGIWVSTNEISPPATTAWIVALASVGFWLLLGIAIWRDYGETPESHGRRIGSQMAAAPDDLYPRLYEFLAAGPGQQAVRTAANQLTQAGLPAGGTSLLALSRSAFDDAPHLDAVVQALEADRSRPWAETLVSQYTILRDAAHAPNLSAIVNLELRAMPAQTTGGGIRVSARGARIDALPPFVGPATPIWQALSDVSVNLSKYAEVDDTGDRLSYLAAALVAIESVQSKSYAVPAPDGAALRAVASRWRDLIAEGINVLSGSAELRLELRTRQVQQAASTALVLKLDNSGRAAAENIRVTLLDDGQERASHHLERLSPNRSEMLEFVIAPGDARTLRVHFRLTWDDRLTADRTAEFADEVRFYETEAEFVPIPNPYIVGHPVKQQQMFFGREDVFHFIEQNLSGAVQDRTIVLYGQRRTGKTSLLYQLVGGRLGERLIAVLIDMQALVMLVDSTADFLGEILHQVELALQDADIAVDVPLIEENTPSPMRVFDRFLDRLERALNDRRLLLIFDEFELIESKIAAGKLDANLLDYFRSLIQHRDTLVFLFAGTHRLEEMSHGYWSILFNIALSYKITFLSEADTVELIRRPVAGALSIDDLAVEKIIRLTNRHPYFTQLLCWALVNHCNTQKHNYATINDVNDAVDAMLTTGEGHFAYIWQQASDTERLVLAGVAHSATQRPWVTPDRLLAYLDDQGEHGLSSGDLVTTLDGLVHGEVLESAGDGSLRYRYQLDVLRLWIHQNKSVPALLERRNL